MRYMRCVRYMREYSRLRSPAPHQGLVYPPKVRAYLDHFEAKGDVQLYDVMAL